MKSQWFVIQINQNYMLLDTIHWIIYIYIYVFLLNSMIWQWFENTNQRKTKNFYNNPWTMKESQHNSMKYQCFVIKNNEAFMILNSIQWQIIVFLLKRIEILWLSIEFNEILMLFCPAKMKIYHSQYNSMKNHCFSIKNNEHLWFSIECNGISMICYSNQ